MAIIGNSFDLDKALQNQGYAYKCWFNYNKDGNTMRISEADIKALTETWSGKLATWEANAERDVTEYTIEGSLEWNEAIDDGKAEAKEAATKDYTNKNGKTKEGWGGSVTNSKNRNVANGVAAGVTAVATGATVATGASVVSSAATPKGGCFVITCPLVLAVGILYEATFPNRKENIALKELKSLMETGQSNMQAASLQMEQADLEMTQLTTASEQDKQTTEEQIAQKQELIKTAQAVYNAIVARVKAGEPISATDKSKLQACKAQIGALQEEINALQLGSIEFSTANSEAIEAKKGEFDTHAQSIAKEKGITDYAASFDEATRTGAIVQIVAQTLNVASGTYAAIEAGIFAASGSWAFGATAWAWAFMAMATAGVGMSAHGVVEQHIIASDVEKEIDVREVTQENIETTTTDYENKLSNMLAQGEFVNQGLDELNEFEQENVVLENVPTSSSENETGAGDSSEPVTTKSSSNPFANNDNNQNNKKNLFAQ